MLKIVLPLLAAVLLQVCTSQTQQERIQSDDYVADPAHNSRNSLDWQGVYTGVLPCADCEGISSMLSLNDSTFTLKTHYLSKNDEVSHASGKFEWSENGGAITLTGIENGPIKYKVGENRLIQLDMEGNEIDGPLKDNYILHKIDSGLLDITWELAEMESKPISLKGNRPLTLTLESKDITARGFAGCNGFGGDYLINNGEIRLTRLFSTQMACEDLDNESRFMNLLQDIDGYIAKDEELVLTRDNLPIVVFKKGNQE